MYPCPECKGSGLRHAYNAQHTDSPTTVGGNNKCKFCGGTGKVGFNFGPLTPAQNKAVANGLGSLAVFVFVLGAAFAISVWLFDGLPMWFGILSFAAAVVATALVQAQVAAVGLLSLGVMWFANDWWFSGFEQLIAERESLEAATQEEARQARDDQCAEYAKGDLKTPDGEDNLWIKSACPELYE